MTFLDMNFESIKEIVDSYYVIQAKILNNADAKMYFKYISIALRPIVARNYDVKQMLKLFDMYYIEGKAVVERDKLQMDEEELRMYVMDQDIESKMQKMKLKRRLEDQRKAKEEEK